LTCVPAGVTGKVIGELVELVLGRGAGVATSIAGGVSFRYEYGDLLDNDVSAGEMWKMRLLEEGLKP
jgi:hypothetical protein